MRPHCNELLSDSGSHSLPPSYRRHEPPVLKRRNEIASGMGVTLTSLHDPCTQLWYCMFPDLHWATLDKLRLQFNHLPQGPLVYGFGVTSKQGIMKTSQWEYSYENNIYVSFKTIVRYATAEQTVMHGR